MEEIRVVTDDNRDSNADSVIQSCFDLKNPKSFFYSQVPEVEKLAV